MLGLGNGIGNYIDVWKPTDISSLLIWYSTINGSDDMTLGDDDTKVAAWQDLSGNDNLASQSTPGKQTDYTEATASVDFDETGGSSVDDYMGLKTQLTLDTDSTGWTVAANYTSLDWNGSSQAIVGDKDDSNNFIRHTSGGNVFLAKIGGNSNNITLDGALTDSQFYSIILTCSTEGDLAMYVDGTLQADTENCGTNDLTIDQICARANSNTLGGKVRDILVYRQALSVTDIALLSGFLEGRGF